MGLFFLSFCNSFTLLANKYLLTYLLSYVCLYAVTKYSIMCLSFYSLIVSKDNAYKNCFISCPEVKEEGKRTWCQSRLVGTKIL